MGKGTPAFYYYSSSVDGLVWEWGLSVATFPVYCKRCRECGFLCEIFQFLNVGAKMFRNTGSQTQYICVPNSAQEPRGCSLWTGCCPKSLPHRKGFGLAAGCPFNLYIFGSLYYFCYSLSRVDEGLSVTVFINTLKNSIWYAECEVGLIWRD